MNEQGIRLGVNIDHVATLRQARGTDYPSPVEAGIIVQESGADGLTLHLREDRRHIQDNDVETLKAKLTIPMNLEMAATDEMVAFAEKILPSCCCLVPEKRQELTTEGGLDVAGQLKQMNTICQRLAAVGIVVSLFIDPEEKQIDAASACLVPTIELHTGNYADVTNPVARDRELERIQRAVEYAAKQGLIVNAGHGLHYQNVQPIAAIKKVNELNIGHSIIAKAVFVGLASAVREMKELMACSRPVFLKV